MISDATEKELVFLNLYYLYASVREPGGLGHIVSHRDTIWHILLIFLFNDFSLLVYLGKSLRLFPKGQSLVQI